MDIKYCFNKNWDKNVNKQTDRDALHFQNIKRVGQCFFYFDSFYSFIWRDYKALIYHLSLYMALFWNIKLHILPLKDKMINNYSDQLNGNVFIFIAIA